MRQWPIANGLFRWFTYVALNKEIGNDDCLKIISFEESANTKQKDNGAVSLPVNTFLSVSFMDISYDEMSVKVEAYFEREKRKGKKKTHPINSAINVQHHSE